MPSKINTVVAVADFIVFSFVSYIDKQDVDMHENLNIFRQIGTNQVAAVKILYFVSKLPNKLTYRPCVDWSWQLAQIVVNPYL